MVLESVGYFGVKTDRGIRRGLGGLEGGQGKGEEGREREKRNLMALLMLDNWRFIS